MAAVLRISSVNEGNALEFEPDGPDCIVARVQGPKVQAVVRAWLYEDASSFVAFFESMAAEWHGWMDVKTWASIEGELKLDASVDRAGHVKISVRMQEVRTADPWSLVISIETEAGQLSGLATQARRMFGVP